MFGSLNCKNSDKESNQLQRTFAQRVVTFTFKTIIKSN